MRKRSMRTGAVAHQRRRACAAAAALLLIGVGGATAAPAGAAPDPAGPGLGGVVSGLVARVLDPTGVRSYWTASRMERAVALDRGPDGAPVDDATAAGTATSGGTVRARAGLVAPRSVGKLFFRTPTGDAVCSASAVNSASRDTIVTAAHCAHSGAATSCGLLGLSSCPGAYYTDFMFVPRYANGTGPDGAWVGTRVVTTPQWIASEDLDFDQAMLQVAPVGGRRLVDVVGGNGLAFGYPTRQNGVQVWGWPAEGAYDGETVEVCTGSTAPFQNGGDAGIACPLTGGASGGPWYATKVDGDVGYVWAVTSRRTLNGPPTLIAKPFSPAILDLLAAVGGGPTSSARLGVDPVLAGAVPTSGAVRASRTTSRGIRLRATPAVARTAAFGLRVRTAAGRRVVIERRTAGTRTWRRVLVTRTDATGIAQVTLRGLDAGTRYYRARTTGKRLSRPARVDVQACPVVGPGVGCTAPSR